MLECYKSDCPLHMSKHLADEGPFCYDDKCRNPVFMSEYETQKELYKKIRKITLESEGLSLL